MHARGSPRKATCSPCPQTALVFVMPSCRIETNADNPLAKVTSTMNDLSRLNETILGSTEPLGAVLLEDGVHFAVASADADAIDVCLFDEAGQEIERIPLPGRTGD